MGRVLKERKNKRGRGSKGKQKELSLNVFSTNAARLKSKVQSCKNEIKALNVGMFSIQETHFNKKGKFQMDGYEIFESIRKKKDGGTLIGVHKALKPMLIEEYNDTFELIVVEVNVSG